MKALYGFGKPYDFHKVLPCLAGLFLLLTILAAAGARFAATGHWNWGPLREAYLLYLIGLSLAGMLLSIFPRIAWLVLAICLHRVSYRCRQLCIDRNPCIAKATFSRNRNRKRRTIPISSTSSGNSYSKLLPSPSLPDLT